MTLSATKIGLWEQCPKQYRLRYDDRRRLPGAKPVNLAFGTVVHETLEDAGAALVAANYSGDLAGGVDRLQRLYWRKFAASSLTGADYYAEGERLLASWARRMGHTVGSDILAVEQRFYAITGYSNQQVQAIADARGSRSGRAHGGAITGEHARAE